MIWEARRREGSFRAGAISWKNAVDWNGFQRTPMGSSQIPLAVSIRVNNSCGFLHFQLHRSQSYLDYQCSPAGWSVCYPRSTILSLSTIPTATKLFLQLRSNQMTPAAALKNVAFEISQSQLGFFKCNFGIMLI